jgi:diguanylate cyclase (GGDEF)-like protein/PAS domain S-box-containing protein
MDGFIDGPLLINSFMHSSLVYLHVIENMHDGVLTIDHAGVITTVNRAAADILELREDQVADKKLSDVFFNYPENDDFIQIILDAVYDASMTHHKICAYFTGRHHKTLFMTTSFLKVNTENGLQSIGVTVLFSDVTELHELRDAAAANEKIKELNQKLRRLSYLDELTGLPNRRYFNDVCAREWRRSIREQKSLSVIMIDADYFKEINDNRGHEAGDECLVTIAKTLNKALRRPDDLVARYGGDEFIAVISGSDIKAARNIAEKMLKGIRGLNIENGCSPYGRLTVSIGVASQKSGRESGWKELIKAADQALYRAKQKGRNQISE